MRGAVRGAQERAGAHHSVQITREEQLRRAERAQGERGQWQVLLAWHEQRQWRADHREQPHDHLEGEGTGRVHRVWRVAGARKSGSAAALLAAAAGAAVGAIREWRSEEGMDQMGAMEEDRSDDGLYHRDGHLREPVGRVMQHVAQRPGRLPQPAAALQPPAP